MLQNTVMVGLLDVMNNARNFSDPNVTKYSHGRSSRCYEQSTSITQQKSYRCSFGTLDYNDMVNTSTTWQDRPTQLIQSIPTYFYRDENKKYFYLFNSAINNSTLAKMWFREEEASKYFEEVFHHETVKVFKVNKDIVNK